MVNEYIYNEKVATDVLLLWWKERLKSIIVFMIMWIILGIFCLIMHKTELAMIVFIAAILIIILYYVRISGSIRTECKRIRRVYGEKRPVFTIELGKKIKLTTNGKSTDVSYDEINQVYENKRLILICLKDGSSIALPKAQFVSGDAQMCMNRLKN